MSKYKLMSLNKYVIEKGVNINDVLKYYIDSELISFNNAIYYDNRMIYLRFKNGKQKIEK